MNTKKNACTCNSCHADTCRCGDATDSRNRADRGCCCGADCGCGETCSCPPSCGCNG